MRKHRAPYGDDPISLEMENKRKWMFAAAMPILRGVESIKGVELAAAIGCNTGELAAALDLHPSVIDLSRACTDRHGAHTSHNMYGLTDSFRASENPQRRDKKNDENARRLCRSGILPKHLHMWDMS